MKKNYFFTLLLLLFFSAISFGQQALITAYVDAPCSGATPRTVEIYVEGTIDFTGWALVKQTNGAGFSPGSANLATIDISSLGSITDSFVYITNSSANLNTEFGISTNLVESGSINSNGDDAFQLVNSSDEVVDRFGEDEVDGTGTDWEHEDTYVYRNNGSTPNAGVFIVSNWTIGAKNLLDGTCGTTLGSLVPLGTYSTVASTTPSISIIGTTTSFAYFENDGPSPEQSISVSADNLTSDLIITAPANYEISLTSGASFVSSIEITPTEGVVVTTEFFIRLKTDLAVNNYLGDLELASSGATSQILALVGEVVADDPQITITAFVDDLNYVASIGGPSQEENFTLEGLFLTSDVVVTAPTNFEVSLTTNTGFASSVNITPTSGTVVETQIFIRLKTSLSIGNYSGDITISSTGITDEIISLKGTVYGAPTNSLVIAGVYDGPLTGGNPKGIELYAVKDIADLSLYGVSSITNGGGSSAGNVEYNFPADAVTAGTSIFISTEAPGFTSFFGFAPTYTNGVVSINGDDSIELYENGQIIDTFGDVDTDGSGEAWDYLDGWAYRKSNTGPDGSSFVIENWTFSGVDGLEGAVTNGDLNNPYPYSTLATITHNIEGFKTYPNPVSNGRFTISSSSQTKKEVSLFNVLGKKVFSSSFSGLKKNIDISNLSTGIYILKVAEGTSVSTKKLVVR